MIKSVGDARCIDASYLNTKHKLEDTKHLGRKQSVN